MGVPPDGLLPLPREVTIGGGDRVKEDKGHMGQMCAHTTQLCMAQSVTYTVLRGTARGVNIYSNVSLSHRKLMGQCSLVLRPGFSLGLF